ncbi:hypothetical protein ACFE04_030308 [Oxalis oulophora]
MFHLFAFTNFPLFTRTVKRLICIYLGVHQRFFCGGRLIFGPDVGSIFLSALLIAAPAVAFCVRIYHKINDKHTINPAHWYPVLAVGVFLTVLDLMCLFLTSSRDPGIVPRNLYPPDSGDVSDMPTPSMEWINGRTPQLKVPRTRDVIINGYPVKVKYCDTCLLYRPPRASHCSICNNCVQKFDHHCPWVGQCIGIRNYRFFFMFILSSTILCVYVFTFSWINILSARKSVWRAMSKDITSLVLLVYCFVCVWFVGGLTIFHSYLICTNQTTYENFRYRYDRKENPFNKGTLRNIKETFFSMIPPSVNAFRSHVNDEEHLVEVAGTTTPEERITNDKEKIDIEMGNNNQRGEESRISLPEILRNLNYDDLDDNLKIKDEEGMTGLDSLLPTEQDTKESAISIVEDGKRESVRISNSGIGKRGLVDSDALEVEKRESLRISSCSKDEHQESDSVNRTIQEVFHL